MSQEYKKFFKKAQEARQKDVRPAPKAKPEIRTSNRPAVRKARAPFPWKAAIGLAVSLVVAVLYLIAPNKFENFVSRVEFHAVGPVAAEKSQPAAQKKETSAAVAKSADKSANPDAGLATEAEHSHFDKLKQRKVELDQREKELAELEEELQKQKVELDRRIQQLEEMRNQIAQILKDRVEVDQEKVNKLVDLYSNMKPKQAADVIGTINEELAVEVLAKMKKKNAAEIMNLLPPEKAKVLSEKYTGYRRAHGMDPKG